MGREILSPMPTKGCPTKVVIGQPFQPYTGKITKSLDTVKVGVAPSETGPQLGELLTVNKEAWHGP